MLINTVIMMRYLISQVWREQNTEINVCLRVFENASGNMRQSKIETISNDRPMNKGNVH